MNMNSPPSVFVCQRNLTQTQRPLFCDGTVSILCFLHPALFLFAQPSKRTHLVIPNGGNPTLPL